jgi:heptosyltransferase-2
VGGHLGDAIISTSALELARGAFPSSVEFGIVTPSWSRHVYDNDDRVRWSHAVDHWRTNRRDIPVHAKVAQYRRSWRTALSEIREVGYDIAFDIYPYYPNMAGLLWRAEIPRRYGFSTGGRGALYTATIPWVDDRCHIAEKQARLIRSAFAEHATPGISAPTLAPPSSESSAGVARMLEQQGVGAGYVILHAGSGVAARLWPVSSWRALAERVAGKNPVVLTGVGAAEEEVAHAIAAGLPNCFNFTGRLDWQQLNALVAGAAIVVSGETSLGHLAAARRVPGVAIYSGITDTREWRPLGGVHVPLTVLSAPVPCAPCFRGDGCATMDCVRGVSVDDVARAIQSILETR